MMGREEKRGNALFVTDGYDILLVRPQLRHALTQALSAKCSSCKWGKYSLDLPHQRAQKKLVKVPTPPAREKCEEQVGHDQAPARAHWGEGGEEGCWL